MRAILLLILLAGCHKDQEDVDLKNRVYRQISGDLEVVKIRGRCYAYGWVGDYDGGPFVFEIDCQPARTHPCQVENPGESP